MRARDIIADSMTFRYQLTRITRNSLISKGFHKAIVGSVGTYDACGHKHGCQQNPADEYGPLHVGFQLFSSPCRVRVHHSANAKQRNRSRTSRRTRAFGQIAQQRARCRTTEDGGFPRRCGCGRGGQADGCSDLVVNANSTETIGVPLSTDALAYARANSPVTVGVTANTNQTANCSDIPQLAATCAQIVAADDRAGDGLERHVAGQLQVSAT